MPRNAILPKKTAIMQ